MKNAKNLLPAVDIINSMLIVAFRAYFCSVRSVIASPETTEHLQATGLFWFTICEMFLITWNKVGSLTHSGTSNKGDRDLFFCLFLKWSQRQIKWRQSTEHLCHIIYKVLLLPNQSTLN